MIAENVRPGDVVRLATSADGERLRVPTKRDVANGKNTVIAKVLRVHISRSEDFDVGTVRRSASVCMSVDLYDAAVAPKLWRMNDDFIDVRCGAKAPIEKVTA